MRDNITLEHQIDGLTSQCRKLVERNQELEERLAVLERDGKLLEAQRLRMRTTYDIEMMQATRTTFTG